MTLRFPEGFLWGASTAAYQIEGAAAEDGRRPSIWDDFVHAGHARHGETGDVAADHYHRSASDLDLMADLGMTAYRFSIAWTRTMDDDGAVNQKGLDFYRRLADGLRERGIEPFATLYHFDLPRRLGERGGWLDRDTAYRLADHADLVSGALGDRIGHWMTVNELFVETFLGYATGDSPPGRESTGEAVAASHHMLLGHGLAAQAVRANGAGEVGIVTSFSPVRPATADPRDAEAARRIDGLVNRFYLDALFRGEYPADLMAHYADLRPGFTAVRDGDLDVISAPLDFLGLNYYFSRTVAASGRDLGPDWVETPLSTRVEAELGARDVVRAGETLTAIGWPVDPGGLTELLLRLRADYGDVPIYITENGLPLGDYVTPDGRVHDPERIEFLRRHLTALHAAVAAGVDVRGYLTWSLLDNFEWGSGYAPRFGLTFVDYGTQRRIPKDSFHWYREVIARNGL
ncbi:GH1 family beta-glucosidase [Actinomadura rayongensis]|uniref:GH1 family beta-glucosidase n=1 Tax=Actinomadura rayongensis TaxID=1429076 RepID=UPI00301CE25A